LCYTFGMDLKKRILIVEDEKPLLRVLTDELVAHGFDVIAALDGEEGLALALKEHPDLVLLDIILPKMDGMTMLKRLREDVWGKTVPVILLTNVVPDERTMRGVIEDKVAYYLVKTEWKIGDVTQKIKDALGLK